MSIRNDLLLGSDWVSYERLYAADLNDTFDATIDKAEEDLQSSFTLQSKMNMSLSEDVGSTTNSLRTFSTNGEADDLTETNFTYQADENVWETTTNGATLVSPTKVLPFKTIQKGMAFSEWTALTIYDEIDDSSIDTNLWTSLYATEDADRISVNPALGLTGYLQSISGMSVGEVWSMKIRSDYSTGTKTSSLKITDGSNTVTLISSFSNDVTNIVSLSLKDASTLIYWMYDTSGNLTHSGTANVSTITGNKLIRFEHYNVNGTNSFLIYWVRKHTGSEASSCSVKLTANGTNYLEVTPSGNYLDLSSQDGGIINCKVTATISGDEIILVRGLTFSYTG